MVSHLRTSVPSDLQVIFSSLNSPTLVGKNNSSLERNVSNSRFDFFFFLRIWTVKTFWFYFIQHSHHSFQMNLLPGIYLTSLCTCFGCLLLRLPVLNPHCLRSSSNTSLMSLRCDDFSFHKPRAYSLTPIICSLCSTEVRQQCGVCLFTLFCESSLLDASLWNAWIEESVLHLPSSCLGGRHLINVGLDKLMTRTHHLYPFCPLKCNIHGLPTVS